MGTFYRPTILSTTPITFNRSKVHLLTSQQPSLALNTNLMINNNNNAILKSSSLSLPFLTKPRLPISPYFSLLPHSSGSATEQQKEEEEEDEDDYDDEEEEEEVGHKRVSSVLPSVWVSILPFLLDLEWWVRLGLSSILFRLALLPILIHQKKLDSEIAPMMSEIFDISKQIKKKKEDKEYYQDLVKLRLVKITVLYNNYGVLVLNYKGRLFKHISICCFLVIMIMVMTIPSFKYGGSYFFTDLTTRDSSSIFPFLASLIGVVRSAFADKETGMGILDKLCCWSMELLVSRIIMGFLPNAVFCFLIPSELFLLLFELTIEIPRVKKFLRIP